MHTHAVEYATFHHHDQNLLLIFGNTHHRWPIHTHAQASCAQSTALAVARQRQQFNPKPTGGCCHPSMDGVYIHASKQKRIRVVFPRRCGCGAWFTEGWRHKAHAQGAQHRRWVRANSGKPKARGQFLVNWTPPREVCSGGCGSEVASVFVEDV
jgi:hypothetical protein